MHIPHLEDLILEGPVGTQKAYRLLKAIHNSQIPVNVKWDGAPAIVAGINPENGKFFVGTKAVLGKTKQKLCYSSEDIEKFYPWDHCLDLRLKLNLALRYLPELEYNGIFQGDFLFTYMDKNLVQKDGHILFTPNTITYKVKHGKDGIENQFFGLAVHTRYQGTISNLVPILDLKASEFKQSPHVWLVDGTYDSEISQAVGMETGLMMVEQTAEVMDQSFLADLPNRPKFTRLFYDLICTLTNKGKEIDLNLAFLELVQLQLDQWDNEPIVMISAHNKRQQFLNWLNDNEEQIQWMFRWVYSVTQCKKVLIEKLNRNEPIQMMINGCPCGHEGFIVDGVKLVDRASFTYMNHLKNQNRTKVAV